MSFDYSRVFEELPGVHMQLTGGWERSQKAKSLSQTSHILQNSQGSDH